MFLSLPYIIFESLFFGLLPLLVLKKNSTLLKYRHYILLIIILYISYISTKITIPPIIQAFYVPNVFYLLLFSIIPSLTISLYVYRTHHRLPKTLINSNHLVNHPHLPSYFPLITYPIISVPVQEVIFRWFYMTRISAITPNTIFILLFSSFIFGLAHIPFGKKDPFTSTFFLGIYWGLLYIVTQNLWFPILSHAIIGSTFLHITLYPPVKKNALP